MCGSCPRYVLCCAELAALSCVVAAPPNIVRAANHLATGHTLGDLEENERTSLLTYKGKLAEVDPHPVSVGVALSFFCYSPCHSWIGLDPLSSTLMPSLDALNPVPFTL